MLARSLPGITDKSMGLETRLSVGPGFSSVIRYGRPFLKEPSNVAILNEGGLIPSVLFTNTFSPDSQSVLSGTSVD